MHESSKALIRRLHDSRFATRYFVGQGLDVGAGSDPLSQYAEQFPLMLNCRDWDLADGDAQFLATIADASQDFVHSSHCLEHLRDPREAIHHWLRVLKPGGHLIVVIPDEDLYEQGKFPSTFNTDHKWTFTTSKGRSWSEKSINLMRLLSEFSGLAQTLKVERLDATYRFGWERKDQTLTQIGESAIEFILRKWTDSDLAHCGRFPGNDELQPCLAPDGLSRDGEHDVGVAKKMDRIKLLKPLREFLPSDAVEQERHLRHDSFLYQAGESRYLCAILGAIHEELEHDRPDLVPLLLECVWMARRMNDAGKHQREIWKDAE